jgi:hypothetical protein
MTQQFVMDVDLVLHQMSAPHVLEITEDLPVNSQYVTIYYQTALLSALLKEVVFFQTIALVLDHSILDPNVNSTYLYGRINLEVGILFQIGTLVHQVVDW